MKVNLTHTEILYASAIGCMRQVQNLKKRRKPAYGSGSNSDWQLHIEGALGECAVAKALGIYWSGAIGDLKAGDVDNIQVRTTAHKNGHLIMHPEDDDGAIFLLVLGANGQYNIAGWILGLFGKNQKFWQDKGNGRPAFFIPQTDLVEIAKLK